MFSITFAEEITQEGVVFPIQAGKLFAEIGQRGNGKYSCNCILWKRHAVATVNTVAAIVLPAMLFSLDLFASNAQLFSPGHCLLPRIIMC